MMVWGCDGVWHWDPSQGASSHPHVLPESRPCPTALSLPPPQYARAGTGLEGWVRAQIRSYPVPAPQQDFLEHPGGHLQGGEQQEGSLFSRQCWG